MGMALIVIFLGSIIGILSAIGRMVFLGASVWQGVATYLSVSFGVVLVAGVLAFAICKLKLLASAQPATNPHVPS